jgi:hypothetical protein
MGAFVACLASACGLDPPDEEFGFVGEVADSSQNASAIGLFFVSSATPVYVYKLGDGSSVLNQFDISFETVPPPEALNSDGIGIAQIGLLPGIATVPDGIVDESGLRLIGLTSEHAVIFKSAGAVGPAWTQQFPEGYSCAQCVRDPVALDTFEPTLCALVVAERVFPDPCAWF